LRADALRWAPEGAPILDGLDLDFGAGTLTALVGRSGCGKSSLLRLLAGLRVPDGGSVRDVPSRKAFVFQDAALLPWATLRENVSLPGRFGPIADVDAAMARLGLAEHAQKLPGALSGGQRMRASLARALVSRPEVVFLDEAFAALDGLTRASVQLAFLELQAEQGWTVVMVTHELSDAVWMADRVVAVDGPPLRVLGDVVVPLPRPRHPRDPETEPLIREVELWMR
jgi:ABC-type nitrate/sulfonate/bicarbonate transport system ATPase subunit